MSSTSSLYTILTDVWDSTNHALKTVFSMIHTHATNAQGGTLDWDNIWSDAVHSHASNAEGGTIDHGAALTGLTDDDHTQYQKESLLTTAGDMPYATADSTWARLGVGTALQVLRTNATATAPEWWTNTFILSSKLITGLREAPTASGDVAYTGVGFQPTAIIALAGHGLGNSIGFGDDDLGEMCVYKTSASNAFNISTSQIVHSDTGTVHTQTAVLKTLDADGFTLTWTKEGDGQACTLVFLCLR